MEEKANPRVEGSRVSYIKEAALIGVDPGGFDVRTENGDFYFNFDKECLTVDAVRDQMVQKAKE